MSPIPLAAVLLLVQLPAVGAAKPQPSPTAAGPRPYPDRLQWWAEARFGMFIHWGCYQPQTKGETRCEK
jgi:hypothetical protein